MKDDKKVNLGQRLKTLRNEKKLTLSELSRKANVARATISRVEMGRICGNLRTHLKLCQALDITLKEFYLGTKLMEGEVSSIEPGAKEAELFTYDEKTRSVILTTGLKKKNMLPQLLILKSQGQTHLEQNPYGTEKFLFGLEGELEAKVGEKTYSLKKGGALYFKSSYPHFIRNLGQEEARCLCITSPVSL